MADKKTKILSAIRKIHQSVGVNLELNEVARILVDELVTIVDCSRCAILRIEGAQVKALAQKGFSKMLDKRRFSAGVPVIHNILNTKQCICTGDVDGSIATGSIPADCSIKSLICSPVMVNEEVKAIIHIDSPDKDAFDAEDLQFVELLAREVSVAVERSILQSQVKALSITDSLTGCFNRRKLEEDIEDEVARAKRYEKPLSLFMIDVDWLKKYNDVHGHSLGDLLLKKIAEALRRNVRNIDKVYRYGGEEFIVLLPETGKWKALTVARRLHKIIEEQEFAGEKESQPNRRVTVSIGVASYPWDGNYRDELLKSADSALYRAKQSGRNRICVFDTAWVNSSSS
jgi:diguanylate cyclase (GGDEF)-like protein